MSRDLSAAIQAAKAHSTLPYNCTDSEALRAKERMDQAYKDAINSGASEAELQEIQGYIRDLNRQLAAL